MYSNDEDKEKFSIPEPPDSNHHVMPKRRFLRELSLWRRSLHQYKEWLEAKHAIAGAKLPPLKKAKGSIGRQVVFWGKPKQNPIGGAAGPSSA
jgi:hypothetical protein